jgi:DNA-binding NarL/FixJ family response regulator
MIRVFLVDDHAVLRSGLRALLGSYEDIAVVGEASDGDELLDVLARTSVDVVVMDVRMPGMDGAEAACRVRDQYPGVHILGLSMATDPTRVEALLAAGFSGYALKSATTAEVVFAIRRVAAGLPFLSTELGLDCLKTVDGQVETPPQYEAGPSEAGPAHRALSRREMEVLQLVAAGYSNEEIAQQLFTSKRTVETHRQNLIAKTRTKNTAALIGYAVRQGLV